MDKINEFTRKLLGRNNEKIMKMAEDPMVQKIFEDITEQEESDFYIHMAKKKYNGDPGHDAFVTLGEYKNILENLMQSARENKTAEIDLWHLRYCWITPEFLNAGFTIATLIGTDPMKYMSVSEIKKTEPNEETVKMILDAVSEITEEAVKNDPEKFAKNIGYVITADYLIGDYIENQVRKPTVPVMSD